MLAPTVYDPYNRTTASGWGTSLSGHVWASTVPADTSTVPATATTPGFGVHAVSALSIARLSTLGPNVADFDVRLQVGIGVRMTGTGAGRAGVVGRFANSSNYYRLAAAFNPDGTLSWQIVKVVAGVSTSIGGGAVGISYFAVGRYWLRAKAIGTSLMVKVWSDATGEPYGWTGTVTDGALSAAGQVGVSSSLDTGNTNALPVNFRYSYFTSGPFADAPGKPLAYSLEAAFGADITTDAATWQWTDLNALGDVLLPDANSPAVNIAPFGQTDWSAQAPPATLSATLLNASGRYAAYTGTSPNWPNVVKGTPIRLRVCYSIVRFFGFANGWPPTWSLVTTDPVVALTASGSLRRLQQGKTPLRSTVTRRVLADATAFGLRQYWPCEDSAGSTQAASAMAGNTTPLVAANVAFAGINPTTVIPTWLPGGSPAIGIDSMVQLNQGGTLAASFPAGNASQWSVQVGIYLDFVEVVTNGSTAAIRQLAEWYTPGGTYVRWRLVQDPLTGTFVYAYKADGTSTQTGDPVHTSFNTIDFTITAFQSGGNVICQLSYRGNTAPAATLPGTLSGITGIKINPDAQVTNSGSTNYPLGAGQVRIWDTANPPIYQPFLTDPTMDCSAIPWYSYRGENAITRLQRLCAEEGVPLSIAGASIATMGAQTVDTFLNLVRQCATLDMGALSDGQGAGLSYVTRALRENQPAALTLNASLEQLSAPFQPADDDQRTRNDWTVTRTNGSFAHAVDADPADALSTKRVGVYDDSVTVNAANDADLANLAVWRVHMGIVDGFRYPTLPIDLFRNPEIGAAWLDVDLTERVDVINLPAPHPPGTVSLVVEGYAEAIGDFAWSATANCSLFNPWRIIQLAADTGDISEFLCHLDTDGSTLSVGIAAGATSLAILTNNGPLWTTNADDFPLTINLAGLPVTVTNITGSSSPQTATVVGATVLTAVSAGAAISVWNPPVLGL